MFKYYPGVYPVDHHDTDAWIVQAIENLLALVPLKAGYENVTFGIDRQYDRTLDADGNPGGYLQVWMNVEEDDER